MLALGQRSCVPTPLVRRSDAPSVARLTACCSIESAAAGPGHASSGTEGSPPHRCDTRLGHLAPGFTGRKRTVVNRRCAVGCPVRSLGTDGQPYVRRTSHRSAPEVAQGEGSNAVRRPAGSRKKAQMPFFANLLVTGSPSTRRSKNTGEWFPLQCHRSPSASSPGAERPAASLGQPVPQCRPVLVFLAASSGIKKNLPNLVPIRS